jgi:hypothetical protein
LHAGKAAENGLLAAQAAREGVTGTLDMLEGEAGMGRAMSGSPDWRAGLKTLGRDFHITHITFKNHACCGHTFAAIDEHWKRSAGCKQRPRTSRMCVWKHIAPPSRLRAVPIPKPQPKRGSASPM